MTLLRRPAQQPGESFGGYILRVSESNGYRFPRRLASLAGVEARSLFSPKLDVAALARVLQRPVESLWPYSDAAAGTLNARLCGQPILASALRPWSPAVCLQCIEERGHIPAWSDLAIVDACPFHGKPLLNSCGSCQGPLAWERWGLARCKCGAELFQREEADISDEHRDLLLDVADAVDRDWRTKWLPRCHAFAGCQSLAGVLAVIRSLTRLHIAVTSDDRSVSTARRAARMATNWPANLLGALCLVGRRVGGDGGLEHLARHRRGTYREFVGQLPASELAHMRLAMAKFSGGRFYQSRLMLPGQRVGSEPSRAVVKKRPAQATFKDDALPQREVVKVAEMPKAVMMYLRRTGYLRVRSASRYVAKFNPADVEELFARLSALPAAPSDGPTISLKEAMLLKLYHADGKGELVAAVLEGAIRVRRQAAGVQLVLDRSDVEAFCVAARRRTFGGAMTPCDAGKRLHCPGTTVLSLFNAGHLSGHRSGVRNLRVEDSSVAAFGEAYLSLAELAEQVGTTSRRLVRLADAHGVDLLRVPAAKKGMEQCFVARADEGRLTATLEGRDVER